MGVWGTREKKKKKHTVGNNVGNTVSVLLIRLSFLEKDGSGSIGNKTPVLHGTHCLVTESVYHP